MSFGEAASGRQAACLVWLASVCGKNGHLCCLMWSGHGMLSSSESSAMSLQSAFGQGSLHRHVCKWHESCITTCAWQDQKECSGCVPVAFVERISSSLSSCQPLQDAQPGSGLMDMWHAGGCSLFATLRDRLERELADAAPQTAKVKVTSPANATERRFAVWIGVLPFLPCAPLTLLWAFASPWLMVCRGS